MTPPRRVIVGSGRSGTTWLLDNLAEANGLRTVFEPLHPIGFRRGGHFAGRRVALGADDAGELEAFLAEALDGRLWGPWPDYRVRPDRLWHVREPVEAAYTAWRMLAGALREEPKRGRPPIVKFIRANLLSEWMADRLDARVVLLVRHPGAVIASKRRLAAINDEWSDRWLWERYQGSPEVHDLYAGALARLETRELSPLEIEAAVWCIENAQPMRRAGSARFAWVSYEHLLENDDAAWQAVLATLDLSARPSSAELGRPSQQASRERTEAAFDPRHLDRWRASFDPGELEALDRVLDAFEVDAYRAGSPIPISSGARPTDRVR